MFEIIAQIIGIIAMIFVIISFQGKNAKQVIGCQLIGCVLFIINFFMLGAITGALMNIIATVRAIVYVNKEKFRADKAIWPVLISVACFASYILTFTMFHKDFNLPNAVLELLPVVANTITTIAFHTGSAKWIRRLGVFVSTCWLIYNSVNFAIGGILCEVFSLISIVIGFLRHDRKNKEIAQAAE